jgi:hypothetical protein
MKEQEQKRTGPTSFYPMKTDDALRKILGVNPRPPSQSKPTSKATKKRTPKK